MKKFLASVTVLCFSMLCFSTFVSAEDKQDDVDRLQKSAEVLQQIMATPDKGIPEEVLDGAKCAVRSVWINGMEGDQVEIASGLNTGDRIILSPPTQLRAGDLVAAKN